MAFGFFDGQKADSSPESIKRKRAMIAQLLSGGRAPRDVGEGFHAIGRGLQAAVLGSRADAEEQANNAERSRIMGGIGFGGGAPMASAGNPVATGSATGSGATGAAPRASRGGPVDPAVVDGIIATAQGLGVDPADLLTSVSYETGGTFNPKQLGPRTQWGQHKGLIQFGEPQAKQHGVDWNNPVGSQLGPNGAIASYLRSTGVKPGMGLLDIYSAINAGGVGRYNRSDAHNGGAPGTVRDKVEQQMAGHRARALALLQERSANQSNMPVVQPGPGAAPMPLARQNAQTAPMPNAAPISGDNRAALLADADYYEQNGNVEAARQMRARAGMAGQAQMASAGPQGDAGQDPGYLGAEQYSGAPAMPTSTGNSYADNEEQTRAMEAQMAAEQGLPYAGNEPVPVNAGDVFSPIPMGAAPNPFLPREPDAMAQVAPPPAPSMDRATFDQITSQTGPIAPTFTGQLAGGVAPSWSENAANNSAGPMGVAPDASSTVNVPMPPRRPAGLAPVQPVVQQPVQQPIQQPPLDQMTFAQQGAANSMDDRFAAQSFASGGMGQAGPRRSILDGLMGGGNSPFVPAAMRGPQPVIPGQSAPMGGSTTAPAAQAQQTGMITPDYVRAVMSSPVTSEADKRFVMDMWNQQRAAQQAEAERARVQAQNEAAARAAGLDPALLGNPVIGKAATEAKFREAPETFRDLTPAERTQRGIDPNDKRPYQISNKTGKLSGVGGAQTNVSVNNSAESEFDKKLGGQQAEMFGSMLSSGTQIQSDIADISQLRELVKTAPTGLQGAAVRFAGNLGIPLGEGAGDVQAFEAIVNRLVPAQRPPGSGTMSDRDVDLFKSSLPRLINQPGGNNRILDTMEGMTRYRQAQFEIARDVAAGQLSRRDALDRLSKLDNPLAWVRQQNRTNSGQTGSTPSAPPPSPAQGGFRILKVE